LKTLSSLYLRSSSDRPPLRIGILLDGSRLIRVFEEIIRDIQQCDFAHIELLIYHRSNVVSPPVSRVRRLLSKSLLWGLYTRLDRKLHPVAEDPLEERDCSGILSGIESIQVTPITQRFVHRFPDDAIETIRSRKLDVLLRFGFNILRGDILQAVQYGVWSFHHGDPDFYRGGPAHFWEMYERNPLSGAVLQILTEDLDAGRMLGKTLFATAPGFSLRYNRLQPYYGSMHLVIQKLWELHQNGEEHLQRYMVPLLLTRGSARFIARPPMGR